MGLLTRFRSDKNVGNEDSEANEGLINSYFLNQRPSPEPRVARFTLVTLLIVTNALWALALLALWSRQHKAASESQQLHIGDFKSAKPVPLKPVQVEFDDLLSYNETSRAVYRAMDPALPVYLGAPNAEIDQAWDELLRCEYPAVSQEEISMNPQLEFTAKDRHPATGLYYAAVDVFHNLHCLNMVRKELDKEYYGVHKHGEHVSARQAADMDMGGKNQQSSLDAAQRDHVYHCMNHIRQSLQCRPDLSPAAMHIYEDVDGSKFFLGNAKMHSCYDWDAIMQWAGEREKELGYTLPVV